MSFVTRIALTTPAAAVMALSPLPAVGQSTVDSWEVCGGSAFVFCAAIEWDWNDPASTGAERWLAHLRIKNLSGGDFGGFRGSVITEIRFEGIDHPHERFLWMEEVGGVHPGPLRTDFLDLPPDEGWWGTYSKYGRTRDLSFSSYQPWWPEGHVRPGGPLALGVASSCGEDLFSPPYNLFVSATCGPGAGSLVPTGAPDYVRGFTTFLLRDEDGTYYSDPSLGGEDLTPDLDFREAQLVVVARDVTDPSRTSVCRVGVNCFVTPEPGAAVLLLTGLAGLIYRRRPW